MKKILSLVLVLAVMLGMVASLASCGATEDPGAEISVYLGEGVFDLDPSDYYVSDNAAQLMSLIYEPLFSINKRGKLKCAAADDYDVDKEKREITITLKETYWSDGTRVKAEDFVYAWRDVILNPDNANPAAVLLYDIENALEVKNGANRESLGVSPRAMYDLVITYREGADYEQLLRNLACVATAPVRQDVKNLAEGHWSKSIDTIVTNGPFMVKSLSYAAAEEDKFGALTLERNKGYHQSSSAKDYDNYVTPYRIATQFTVGENKKVNIKYSDLTENTVFYLGDASLAERAEHKDDAIVSDLASTYTYIFNTNNPLFKDKNVRYALSIALNRAAIVEAITFGKAADGLLSEVSRETLGRKRDALLSASDDITKAKQLINAANITVAKEFTLTVSSQPESLKIASLAVNAWKQLGFTVEINSVDIVKNTVSDKNSTTGKLTVYDSALQYYVKGAAEYGMKKAEFDVIGIDLQTYSDDGFVALGAFASSMNVNGNDYVEAQNKMVSRGVLGGWSSADYDKLIEEAYNAESDKVRREKLIAAEKLLIEEAPIIPIVFNQSFAFVSKEIKSVTFDGFGNIVLTEANFKNYKDFVKEEE